MSDWRDEAKERFRHYKTDALIKEISAGAAVRAVDVASEVLKLSDRPSLDGGSGRMEESGIYLDPVSSFAVQNDGRGYSGEITIFMPAGSFQKAKSDLGAGLRERLADLPGRDQLDGRGGWFIANAEDAEDDGHAVAFWSNEAGSTELVVHMREVERGIAKMPLASINYTALSRMRDHVIPALTGDGIVQHATRSMSAMARDPDYVAAAYMAIHTKMAGAGADFRPIQETHRSRSDQGKWHYDRREEASFEADIKTEAGAGLFLKNTKLDFADANNKALMSVFGVRDGEIRDIRRSVATYIRDEIKPTFLPAHIEKEAKKGVIESVMSLGR